MTPPVQVRLAVPPPVASAGDWSLLSAAERRRARAIGHPAARSRHVTARALLRRLLADELGRPAAGVPLHDGPGGRPVLPDEVAWCSVAHTDGLVVVAVARSGPVGVDVERCDRSPLPPLHAWLSGPELARMPSMGTHEWLVRRWTAKEAVAKALGRGLAMGLATIRVAGDTATVADPPSTWHVEPMPAGGGHIATQAVGAAIDG